MAKNYDPKKIEPKWQKYWETKRIFQAKDFGKKYYALVEFPYPSGDGLHVGHVRSYTALDVVARKRRMEGYNVLYPMGWDAFGLPTENYAIKTDIQPTLVTKKNSSNFRRQIKALGLSFDWSREVNTTDPNYYKWTQWIFLQFFKKGLAYKTKAKINWCPSCQIGLANEEVINDTCERCGTVVEEREKEQWMLAITKYADRLDKDLDLVNYPEPVKLQQRNWIGRKEGWEIDFKIDPTPNPLPKGEGEETQEPSPLGRAGWGYETADPQIWRALQEKALEMRKSPTEAEDVMWQLVRNNSLGYHFRRQQIIGKFIVDFVCLEKKLVVEVDGDIHDYQKAEDSERTKFFKIDGYKVIRFKNEEVIQNIDSVKNKIIEILKALSFGEGLGGVNQTIKIFTTRPETIYGTTFIAKAGKQDKFTGEYAINPATQEKIPIWEAEYVMSDVGTGAIMGVPAADEKDKIFAEKYSLPIKNFEPISFDEALQKTGAKPVTTYKLRDWVFSRQRYWGEPIPLIWCEKCGWQAVSEKDLPVKLPKIKDFMPTVNGDSPLAKAEKWLKVKCPKCGGPARRETDVMPNWAGSSWYYLRYMDPKNKKFFADYKKLKYWGEVDWYNGGMEHTTLHLLYSRFWHKFLYDQKLVPTKEPYHKRTSHGFILAPDGQKMSKSRGNVVNPDGLVKLYGADTLRLYEMFMGPFEQTVVWQTESLIGLRRFLEKVWRLVQKVSQGEALGGSKGLAFNLNQTVKKVTEDIEAMKFNTAISQMMILVNALEKTETIPQKMFTIFLKILTPFAPHICEEIWQKLGHKRFIVHEPWPKIKIVRKENKLEKISWVVQVNGRVRGTISASTQAKEEELKISVLANSTLASWLKSRTIQRVVIVPGRLVNFVIG